MVGNLKDKIMLVFVVLFFIVGGFTFNFYNSLPERFKKICLFLSIILLVIIISFMIVKRSQSK
ncbi:hypothetical protein SDC9_164195 [bioreactor metagenome]|uniref:Uncharacterized protein n=1 Tax=bioreactor metagenome TaxID=1076179 RepID=A0A645FQW9_9ZZZZ